MPVTWANVTREFASATIGTNYNSFQSVEQRSPSIAINTGMLETSREG